MSNLRIVRVRGDEPIRPKRSKSKFKQEVDGFIQLFIEDHNRKFQKQDDNSLLPKNPIK